MKPFEYATPRHEAGVLELLSDEPGHTEVLAGGTDLVGLMKKMIVSPQRVINIKEVASMRGVEADSTGVVIGAVTNLDDLLANPALNRYPALLQAIAGMNSPQLQAQGTIGGDLCQRPHCWYYRNGFGLLGASQLVAQGENRYHAIFGNSGPAKFVSPSRLAPALIALKAKVRVIGPRENHEMILPVEEFFQTPRNEGQREHVLLPNQLLTHIMLPPATGVLNATYEVRQSEGPDFPLTSASVGLVVAGGVVREATIVLGQVAPVPWVSSDAARAIIGKPVTPETARAAGEAAVACATPLSDNGYKVQLARVSVERAILLAAAASEEGASYV
jgi:xanthine dehydrogenase YagS FAD-binding subunit